jgi:hypothetical protein
MALVGLGGAGKTALAARFLAELCQPGNPYRPEGLFVWSFYQEPDAGYFLSEAYRYLTRGAADPAPAKGAGLLHLLREALAVGGPHPLVLDGLERVQRPEGDGRGGFGQVEDPLLRGLLTRLAEGVGKATALVTSRFPLTDLEPMRGRGYPPGGRKRGHLATPAATPDSVSVSSFMIHMSQQRPASSLYFTPAQIHVWTLALDMSMPSPWSAQSGATCS